MSARSLATAGAAVLLLLLVQGVAFAAWSDGAAASGSYASATLAPATSPSTAAGSCTVIVGDRIVVSWTATASSWATGYEITRATSSGGPYAVVGTVATPTVSYTDGPLAFSTTYFYVVKASKGAWRSAGSTPVSRTTRSAICV